MLRETKSILIRALAVLALAAMLAGCTISKTATPESVSVGQNLTFTIALTFEAGDPPEDQIFDNLPDSVRFVSAETDSGECFPPAGDDTVTCNVFNPNPGERYTATVTIVVTAIECGTFTNTASAFGLPDGQEPTEEQLATVEELTGQQLSAEQLSAEQLPLDQLSADQLATIQQELPTIEASANFTVVGCQEPQQPNQQPNQGQGGAAPITQEGEQDSEAGEIEQTFDVS